jgi:3-methyladenine DNA glycosylase/8-oxoguanine DNA glycosylase
VPLLRLPEPYSFELSTERFRAFGTDRANLWHDGALYRVVGGREVRLEAAPGGVRAEPVAGPEIEHLLGVQWDLGGFAEFAADDAVLALAVEQLAGFRPPLVPDPFEALVTSITAQQVSLRAASAIRSRLIERYGEPAEHAAAFPTQERLARVSEDDLFALGFSHRKAEYVLGLARRDLDYDALAELTDEEAKERLTAVRGLGEWTADWYLARHLGRPHAWPAGDLVVRKAVSDLYAVAGDVREFGARFHPFQNLACHYLLLLHRTP